MNDEKIYILNFEKANQEFSKRNKAFLDVLEEINVGMDKTLIQIKTDTHARLGVVIYMLIRQCSRLYEAVILLGMSGHGFSAYRTLRSMFEKLVDALYLDQNPSLIDEFWDYHYVNLIKLGQSNEAKSLDPDYLLAVDKFRLPKNRKRFRPRWTAISFAKEAEDVGFERWWIDQCYRRPSTFIHSSTEEVLSSLQLEDDKSLTPVEDGGKQGHLFADVSLQLGSVLLLRGLKLAIEHFKLNEPAELELWSKKIASLWAKNPTNKG